MLKADGASSLPRVAAARARSHRAKIGNLYSGGHRVALPNGTYAVFDRQGKRRPCLTIPESTIDSQTLGGFLNAYADLADSL